MTYIIAEPCIGVLDRGCVDVCPVDCIYEGPDQLYIHPDECIDCEDCVPVCPVDAIYAEDNLPAEQNVFLRLNAELAEIWPNITEQKDPLPDADDWREVAEKRHLLER